MTIGRPWLGMLAGLLSCCKADFSQLESHARNLETKLQAKNASHCPSSSPQINCTDLQVQIDASAIVKNVGSGTGQAYWKRFVEALQTVAWNPGEDPNDWLHDQLATALSMLELELVAGMASGKALGDDYFWADVRADSGSRRLGSSWNGAQIAAGKPWTNRTMVYAYDPAISWFTKRAMKSAMAEITQKSCVQFREVDWTSTEKKVHVIDTEAGCWSSVGMTGGRQELNLDTMCRFHRVAVHEVLHALGQTHEQMRSDRDHFLEVDMRNVQAGKEHNFDMNPRAYTGRPYDYKSVMHYGRFSFSTTEMYADPLLAWVANTLTGWNIDIGAKATLATRNTGFLGNFGNSVMSDNDVEQLQEMYQCDKLTISSEGSPGWGVRLSGSYGVSLNTGSESVAAVCNSGYAVTSCSCFHQDGNCRGATLTDVTGGSCMAAGTTGASSGMKAHAICHRLKSPHYGSARMSQEASGSASQTCSRDYLLVGCSCYSSGNYACSATPDTSVSPGVCRAASSGRVTAQAICLRTHAVATVRLETGTASDVSKAVCPSNTQLAGCSCGATDPNECKGARPAGNGSNQCWAYAKTSEVQAYALCITLASAPGLGTSEFLIAGGLYTTDTNASSAPVQSLYCNSTGSVAGLTKMGCSSLMVQTRTQTWYNCERSCQLLDLNVKATDHKHVTVSQDGGARCPAGWLVVNIVCKNNCQSLKLTCAPPTIDSPWFLSGTRTYSPWFNGNTGSAMATCGQSLAIGAECASSSLLRDTSCYYIRLVCRRLGIAIGDDKISHSMFDVGFAEHAWSEYATSTGVREAAWQWQFTESLETGISNPRFGPGSAVQCRGSNCDELRFQLPRLFGSYGDYKELGGTPSILTKQFRDGSMECPMGHFVAGMRCSESYCNTKELLCATPNSTQWMVAGEQFYSYCFTNMATISLSWTDWLRDKSHSLMGRAKTCAGTEPSDMPDSQSCGQDGLVVGLKCFGKDCDRLQLVCRGIWVNLNETSGEIGDVSAEVQSLQELQLYNDMSSWISKPRDGKVSSSRWNGVSAEGGQDGIQQDVNFAIRLASPMVICIALMATLIVA